MIQDVDETLKQLLLQRVAIPTDVGIRFEMPTKEWVASLSLTQPTINLFLYDIRENHELRSSDRTFTRNGDTGVITQAPVRMDLSYLISVWSKEVVDEHMLLGQILAGLLQFPLLPDDILQGSLVSQPVPVQCWVAQPERLPNPWEFWGHMDHGMKAALNFVVTTAWQPTFAPATVNVVLTKDVGVEISNPTPPA